MEKVEENLATQTHMLVQSSKGLRRNRNELPGADTGSKEQIETRELSFSSLYISSEPPSRPRHKGLPSV